MLSPYKIEADLPELFAPSLTSHPDAAINFRNIDQVIACAMRNHSKPKYLIIRVLQLGQEKKKTNHKTQESYNFALNDQVKWLAP